MVDVANAALASLAACGGSVITIGIFGWRARDWLGKQFDTIVEKFDDKFKTVTEKFDDTVKAFDQKFDAHEALDQTRHEQNLERFTDIRIELARGRLNSGKAGSS